MSRKQKKHVKALVEARTEFAGIGTRRAKLFLNKAGKTDNYALALRTALEAEDANLTAKRYYGGDCGGYSYADIQYFKKAENIEALIQISKAQKWTFGVQPSDIPTTTHLIYFEIPGVDQISWHYSPREPLPVYGGAWDGKSGSTLAKLETAIGALMKSADALSEAESQKNVEPVFMMKEKLLFEVTIRPLQRSQGSFLIAASGPAEARALADCFLSNASTLDVEESLIWRSMPLSAVVRSGNYEITDIAEAEAISALDQVWDQERIDALPSRRRQRVLSALRQRWAEMHSSKQGATSDGNPDERSWRMEDWVAHRAEIDSYSVAFDEGDEDDEFAVHPMRSTAGTVATSS